MKKFITFTIASLVFSFLFVFATQTTSAQTTTPSNRACNYGISPKGCGEPIRNRRNRSKSRKNKTRKNSFVAKTAKTEVVEKPEVVQNDKGKLVISENKFEVEAELGKELIFDLYIEDIKNTLSEVSFDKDYSKANYCPASYNKENRKLTVRCELAGTQKIKVIGGEGEFVELNKTIVITAKKVEVTSLDSKDLDKVEFEAVKDDASKYTMTIELVAKNGEDILSYTPLYTTNKLNTEVGEGVSFVSNDKNTITVTVVPGDKERKEDIRISARYGSGKDYKSIILGITIPSKDEIAKDKTSQTDTTTKDDKTDNTQNDTITTKKDDQKTPNSNTANTAVNANNANSNSSVNANTQVNSNASKSNSNSTNSTTNTANAVNKAG